MLFQDLEYIPQVKMITFTRIFWISLEYDGFHLLPLYAEVWQSFTCCVLQKNETHTGLEQHKDE